MELLARNIRPRDICTREAFINGARIVAATGGSTNAAAWSTESPDNLWVGHRSAPNQILKRDPSLLYESAAAITAYPGGHVEGYPDTFRALFKEFYAHIASGGQGEPTYPTFADGLRSLVVCDAVSRSSQTNSWTTVPA